jgi:uncharacterized protein (TIGR02246 family)
MTEDEKAIYEMVQLWMAATKKGDLETVLNLMTDDVVFTVPGAEPFGKEKFAAAARSLKNAQIEGDAEVLEVQVIGGDWAYSRSRLKVRMTPPDAGKPIQRSGYVLSVLRKGSDGQWRIARDANMLTTEQ